MSPAISWPHIQQAAGTWTSDSTECTFLPRFTLKVNFLHPPLGSKHGKTISTELCNTTGNALNTRLFKAPLISKEEKHDRQPAPCFEDAGDPLVCYAFYRNHFSRFYFPEAVLSFIRRPFQIRSWGIASVSSLDDTFSNRFLVPLMNGCQTGTE